jgi:hypothetical protein
MWLPKAIEEEGEDLIGKPGKPHPNTGSNFAQLSV